MPFFERHVFVCMNERPPDSPKGCCKARGAEGVLQAFKELVVGRGLSASIRAQKAGCLDYCSHGATVVVYPDGVWYGAVSTDDVAEIVDSHLLGGVPVERLRIPSDARRG